MWNTETVQILRDKWDGDGLPADAIADHLAKILGKPVTKSMVVSKAHRLKLIRRRRGVRSVCGSSEPRRKRHAPPSPHRAFVKTDGTYSPVAPTPEATYADDVVRVSFLDREPGQCGWPIGDPRDAGFGCCGDETENGSLYCPRHKRRAFEPREISTHPADDRTSAKPQSVDTSSTAWPVGASPSPTHVDATSTAIRNMDLRSMSPRRNTADTSGDEATC
ncbi:GcrA family cell cycle regulator [Hyphomicrobium sp. B1]|uniref:GcrA family cell cycle regulator n=1 Tax=Hyphomicrobium sp. B1 TaxID=3075651 RepID=UPI003C2C1BA6